MAVLPLRVKYTLQIGSVLCKISYLDLISFWLVSCRSYSGVLRLFSITIVNVTILVSTSVSVNNKQRCCSLFEFFGIFTFPTLFTIPHNNASLEINRSIRLKKAMLFYFLLTHYLYTKLTLQLTKYKNSLTILKLTSKYIPKKA